jgi:hypothetical protein
MGERCPLSRRGQKKSRLREAAFTSLQGRKRGRTNGGLGGTRSAPLGENRRRAYAERNTRNTHSLRNRDTTHATPHTNATWTQPGRNTCRLNKRNARDPVPSPSDPADEAELRLPLSGGLKAQSSVKSSLLIERTTFDLRATNTASDFTPIGRTPYATPRHARNAY